jgi:pyridoxal phosphate enzyme (YggS family)
MAHQFPYDAGMTPTDLHHNISEINRRIRAAEHAANRPSGAVSLLAVSKKKSSELIRWAHQAGLTDFGENYAQEMAEKATQLADLGLAWHFIGPIQSNKTALIAEFSDWVHSLDRLKIAQRLSDQRPPEKGPLKVLLQVKTSDEASKSGVQPEALETLIDAVNALPNLQLAGLMTIPAPSAEPAAQQVPFRHLRAIQQRLIGNTPNLAVLSMGMSSDLEAAIAEGSNLVRVGTDIFGARYN